ncbi:MAG: hypothetical protein SGILL_008950 [Bacillariaceae sp.]
MWSNYFHLDVMDFYATTHGGDVVHNFICEYIPNATATCNMLNKAKQHQKELSTDTSMNSSEQVDATIVHARKSKSVHEARILAFALQQHNFKTTPGLNEREAKNELYKKELEFEMNTASLLEEHAILSEASPYMDCLLPRMEFRLKSVATSFMEAYHKQKYGRDMSKIELDAALAKQDELFEKNRVKYCDLNVKVLFENATIKAQLLLGMTQN